MILHIDDISSGFSMTNRSSAKKQSQGKQSNFEPIRASLLSFDRPIFSQERTDRLYSVMQSDGNRFCGDVVLDSFDMAYGHKDSILDQKYESNYLGIVIIKILNTRSN